MALAVCGRPHGYSRYWYGNGKEITIKKNIPPHLRKFVDAQKFQMFAQKCIINKYALNIRIQNLVPSGDEPNAGEATGTSDLGSVILKLVSMCVFHVF